MSGEIEQARSLRDLLRRQGFRLVLAESVTAGRISAALSALPGISEHLCGGFVVYRNDSKHRWLGVCESLLDDPDLGPVSAAASEALARSAIERTPEADLALAITGDVGPGAPKSTDGKIFLHWIEREFQQHDSCGITVSPGGRSLAIEHHLTSPAPTDAEDVTGRLSRLTEATEVALRLTVLFLEDHA